MSIFIRFSLSPYGNIVPNNIINKYNKHIFEAYELKKKQKYGIGKCNTKDKCGQSLKKRNEVYCRTKVVQIDHPKISSM